VTTRRQALVGAAAGALGLRVPVAQAADAEKTVLEALLAYQQQAVFAYDLALRRAPLKPADRRVLAQQRDRAAGVAGALRSAVVRSGGTPIAPPQATAAEVAKQQGLEDYLRYIVAAEEAAVNGFYVALQSLAGARVVRGVAAFMAQGGRRLVIVRNLTGDKLVPRAFETGAG
jgi:hypothetical protein